MDESKSGRGCEKGEMRRLRGNNKLRLEKEGVDERWKEVGKVEEKLVVG
jgi:hypothetical protein